MKIFYDAVFDKQFRVIDDVFVIWKSKQINAWKKLYEIDTEIKYH